MAFQDFFYRFCRRVYVEWYIHTYTYIKSRLWKICLMNIMKNVTQTTFIKWNFFKKESSWTAIYWTANKSYEEKIWIKWDCFYHRDVFKTKIKIFHAFFRFFSPPFLIEILIIISLVRENGDRKLLLLCKG